ncbi:MAG TPA: amino acid permease, partial [Gemmatimonadales bacterium]|nr:amino acid permease [Gemmatimonadales bacterium]
YPTYARRLGLFSGTMAVIGGIIGSGIFLNPAYVAQRVRTPFLTLGVWVLGGAIALAGAFCFGELGNRSPRAGGGYVYLRDAYGGLPAFLYGWMILLVIGTGAIAAVAVTFAQYLGSLFALPPAATQPVAIGAILLLSTVNYVGVKPGAVTQNVFTLLKLAALAVLIGAGLLLRVHVAPGSAVPEAPSNLVLAVGAALVPVLFAYGGWQQSNFIAEEMIDAERNLPRALVIGVTVVVAVYLLANITYLRTLGPVGLAASHAPAADAMRNVLGPAGATVIAAGIAVSSFGFLNLVILVSPRVYQAMSADGAFFPALARLHPRFRTPGGAIIFQGAWAILLTLTGSYGQLLDYVVFGDWIFFGLVVSTLFVYRRRDGAGARGPGSGARAVRGYRAWGYPVTPALFVLAAVYVVASSVASNPRNAAIGFVLLLLGIPVYLFWKARTAPKG